MTYRPTTTPAIATQAAAQPLPRGILWVLCLAYVLAGYMGRAPWKSADVAALGVMSALAQGATDWFNPQLLGEAPDLPALLPYWLGAVAIDMRPEHAEWVVRLPFIAALLASLYLTWNAIFRFALLPAAQPVAFAFGGQASPVDYARSLADGGLLALLACLGLAQLAHETTPSVWQLLGVAAALRGMADFAHRASLTHPSAGFFWLMGLAILALSGKPFLALGLSALPWLLFVAASLRTGATDIFTWALGTALTTALLAWGSDTLGSAETRGWAETGSWAALPELLLWFTWPVWPLMLWTLWRWRGHWRSPHIAAPAAFLFCLLAATAFSSSPERSLMLALPVLALLAAFALPTLKRSMAALIDWFSVLFFTMCAVVVWVVWLAMLTGVPAKPAANVARLAPGFQLEFSVLAFAVAAAASLAWVWAVWWRVSRHPSAMWKSMVLPAGGSVLCWLLLMTLWLPVLDFGRSYRALAQKLAAVVPPGGCVEVQRLTQAQIAGLRHHTQSLIVRHPSERQCSTVVVAPEHAQSWVASQDENAWVYAGRFSRLTDNKESVWVYRRNPTATPVNPSH